VAFYPGPRQGGREDGSCLLRALLGQPPSVRWRPLLLAGSQTVETLRGFDPCRLHEKLALQSQIPTVFTCLKGMLSQRAFRAEKTRAAYGRRVPLFPKTRRVLRSTAVLGSARMAGARRPSIRRALNKRTNLLGAYI
jgi:hypothetical protein